MPASVLIRISMSLLSVSACIVVMVRLKSACMSAIILTLACCCWVNCWVREARESARISEVALLLVRGRQSPEAS